MKSCLFISPVLRVWIVRTLTTGLLFGSPLALAATANLSSPTVIRITSAPVIDGVLDDLAWKQAIPISNFIQIQPTHGTTPTRRTEIQMVHNGRMLFVAIRAYDTAPTEIVARQMLRDADGIKYDDHIALVFDPEGRGRNGFVFRVNANGARLDSLVYDGVEERSDWDAIWNAEARIDDAGWSAELSIPLSAVGAANSDTPWKFNAERWIARASEKVRLYGISADKYLTSLGDAKDLNGIKPDSTGLGVRIKPSIRLNANSSEKTDAKYEFNLEPGLEVFYQGRSNLSAAFAYNLNFGEAEADDRIVNLTRFPLFRPERREFFLRDSGRFSFGGLSETAIPFFSRRIGINSQGIVSNLDFGAKVAGTVAGLDFGVLSTRVEKGEAERAAQVGVMRVTGALSEKTRMGMIATQGNPEGTSGSYLVGSDFQYRNTSLPGDRTLDAFAWMQKSGNPGLGTGQAFGGSINYPNIGLSGNANWQYIDAGFLPALGFITESGVNRTGGEIGWWTRTPKGGDIVPALDWQTRHKLDGTESSVLLNPELYIANAAEDFIFPEFFIQSDRLAAPFHILPGVVIPAGSYRWNYFSLEAGSSPSRPFSMTAYARIGGYYDGRRNDQSINTIWNVNKHWGLRSGLERSDIDLPTGSFVVHTAKIRLNHAASNRFSESLTFQWDNVSKQLGAIARVHWIIVPGREVFLAANYLAAASSATDEPKQMPSQTSVTLKLVWNWER
ncbi:conserved hypothetical protein [Candidatus Nitrotoga sp. HW29]|uniref:carbohydrate binding family 9 domain-containing protein n=1 Tax=Candidatus Nitrotoga sp. HW29 TaxID=2886963 RepID=UPI001EF18C55|nr:carbohydrate binding family 9 domain-containing protein [Candidatus Nitrotoga sp. HW29]CAH1903795.1 conserved hypothetical protein [Candidatus Nitrotoga sp. HW29]